MRACALRHAQASVDSHIIVRELREETKELRALPEVGLDDGIGLWRHLPLFLQEVSNICFPVVSRSFIVQALRFSTAELRRHIPLPTSPVSSKYASTAASQHPEVCKRSPNWNNPSQSDQLG